MVLAVAGAATLTFSPFILPLRLSSEPLTSMRKQTLLATTILLMLVAQGGFAQKAAVLTKIFYPKDSVQFTALHGEVGFGYRSREYGKTTMVICCTSEAGRFYMVFKKDIRHLSRMVEFDNGYAGEVFSFASKQWEHEEGTWSRHELKGEPKDTVVYSIHNLRCLILKKSAAGITEVARFQDYGNEVYWPEFDYPSCSISDEDRDGLPEFYLSYMGNSDGLDAKPYKQLVYTVGAAPTAAVKAKATAYYPAGNEDDVYRVEYDQRWKQLPAPVRGKSKRLIDRHRSANPSE